MKTIISIIFGILFCGSLYSQDDAEPKVSVSFFAEGGYNSFQLETVADNFNAVISEYSSYNIPLKTQELFPGKGIFGGGIYFTAKNGLRIKFGFNITGTEASSHYSDFSGALDIACDVDASTIYMGFQKKFSESGFINPFIDMNIALTSSDCEYSAELNVVGENTQSEKVKFSSKSIYFQPAFGLLYKAAPAELGLKLGYKLPVYKDFGSTGIVPLEIDVSGFFLMASVSVTLNVD